MAKQTFNPIKEDIDGKSNQRIQWSTEILNKALQGINKGKKLVANPFYENNTKILKADLVFIRTAEEIEEWKKCANDIIYFANKYVKMMTPQGVQQIKLRGYQEKYLKLLVNNQLTIYRAARQSAKTTSSAIYLLWFASFNVDKNAIVMGNKGKTAQEILDKVKSMFYELPFFLKPGVVNWNVTKIILDNGCRIITETTVAEPAIGFTMHCVLCDEFAHINSNIQESFYYNIFPTITAANGKLMITSTQNGPELFCKLFIAAENGENSFVPFTTNWQEVPDWDEETQSWVPRTEEWHRIQVNNLGSEEAFNEQFGCDFTAPNNSLIPSRNLTKNSYSVVKFVNKDTPGFEHTDDFYWHPDYDPLTIYNDYIIVTIDISEGIGGDYTVATINKLIGISQDHDRTPITEAIGYFRSNILDDKECCKALMSLFNSCNPLKLIISLESNLNGSLWIHNFKDMLDNTNASISMDNFIVTYNETGTRFIYGIKMTHKTKQLACKLFKNSYIKRYIINNSHIFYNELSHFNDKNGNGSYSAMFGHDDMVMSQIQLALLYDNIIFKDMVENFIQDNDVEDKGQNINFFEYIESNNMHYTGNIYDDMYTIGNNDNRFTKYNNFIKKI